jgi:hypothetical protein
VATEPSSPRGPLDDEGAPSGFGEEDVGLAGDEAPGLDPLDDASWLDADETTSLEAPSLEELGGPSALDDAPADLPIDPIETGAEDRWTADSDADPEIERGVLDDPLEAPLRGEDDGAEGLEDDGLSLDPAPEPLPDAEDEEAPAELPADTLARGGEDDGDTSCELVGLGGHEGERVEVRAGEVRVGPLRIALPGAIAGAIVLDDDHLLVWSDDGRARLARSDGTTTAEVDALVRRASADGRGGALAIDRAGRILPLVRRGDALHVGAPRGALPGVEGLAVAWGDAFLLAEEKLFRLGADGGRASLPLAGPGRALGVDGRGRLVLACASEPGVVVERWHDPRGERRERLGALALDAGRVRSLAAVESGVFLLVGGRALALPGSRGAG